MKPYALTTADLIDILLENDPEGKALVTVGGAGIYTAENIPLYYDGYPSLLLLDEDKKPYYHIHKLIKTDKFKRFEEYGVDRELRIRTFGRDDLEVFTETKAESALAAGIFHRREVPIAEVKDYLKDKVEIRR